MKRAEKAEIMNHTMSDLNRAKDAIASAVFVLQAEGLERDAETLENMLYRLEAFQTKYDEYRL